MTPTPDAPLTEAELVEIERITEAATAGRWIVPEYLADRPKIIAHNKGWPDVEICSVSGQQEKETRIANGAFITASRTAVPRLIATVRALREREAQLVKAKTDDLFARIKHGDASHRKWLRESIDAWADNRPSIPPYGLGRTEALEKIGAIFAEKLLSRDSRDGVVLHCAACGAEWISEGVPLQHKEGCMYLAWTALTTPEEPR